MDTVPKIPELNKRILYTLLILIIYRLGVFIPVPGVDSQEILKVCQNAMELHGGMGAMLDFGIEKLMRDASIFLHIVSTQDLDDVIKYFSLKNNNL